MTSPHFHIAPHAIRNQLDSELASGVTSSPSAGGQLAAAANADTSALPLADVSALPLDLDAGCVDAAVRTPPRTAAPLDAAARDRLMDLRDEHQRNRRDNSDSWDEDEAEFWRSWEEEQ